MPSSGGGGSSTTTQKFEPPDYTKPYWESALQQGGELFSRPFQQYDGPRIAPLNDVQNTGLQMAIDRGLNGSPDLNTARQSNLMTSNGSYLGANPFSSQSTVNNVINDNAGNMINAARLGPMAQTDALFARGGAFGGSAYQQMQGQNLAGLEKNVGQMANSARLDYNNMGNANWENERNRMLQANAQAPAMASDDWKGIQAVTGAGDAYSAYTQRLLDQGYNDFNQQNNFSQSQLQNMLSLLSSASGTYGQSMSNSSQNLPGMSPVAGLLGAGGLAYGVSQFTPR